MPELAVLLASGATTRVAVIGDLMIDRYTWGHVGRISPEAPVPVVEMSHDTASAGGAANAGVCASALGAAVTVFGAVGEDTGEPELRSMLASAGCDATLLVSTTVPTTTKHRIWAGGQQLLRIDAERPLDSDDAVRFLDAELDAAQFDAVLVSDYGKGFVSPDSFRLVAKRCREAAVPLVVDPKVIDFGVYSGATIIKPNEREARLAFSHRFQRPADDLAEIGRYLVSEIAGQAVITRGPNGVDYFTADRQGNVAVESQNVFDVTGAGDVVAAVLTVLTAAGADLVDACEVANLAARVCVGRVGTGGVTPEKILASIADHHRDGHREGS
jgi:rfaE bifunctional protein kinase chain/domain